MSFATQSFKGGQYTGADQVLYLSDYTTDHHVQFNKLCKLRIAVTGHRPDKLGGEWMGVGKFSDRIKTKLQHVIDQYKPSLMISGMALGVDQMWAELAIENKKRFIAAIPCENQESKWQYQQKLRYYKLIYDPLCSRQYISKEYTKECMQKRNEWMVDNCDILVAVYDGTPGGTANCVKYAAKKNRYTIQINPKV